jgi:hypothetical protein
LRLERKLLRERATVEALEQSLLVQGTHSSPPPSHYYSPPTTPIGFSPATPPSTPGSKFYKGGQFTPGGGRAPKGGCYMTPNLGSSSRSGGGTFYKGGQFTPGGGRAPKGGCWK